MSVRKEAIIRQIEVLERNLAKLESQPEDDFDDGHILSFTHRFTPSGKVYQYAAIKANGVWYTTGDEGNRRRTWDDLLAFIGDAELWYAIQWERVQ